MPPTASIFNIWDSDDSPCLDCLLPTGILVQLHIPKDSTLAEIKETLWQESQKYPLYSSLKDKNTYVFMCINQMAEKETLLDEDKRLCEVKPFQPMLKVVEKKADRHDSALKSQISLLIGKPLHEIDSLKSSEVSDFRVQMKSFCSKTADDRDQTSWLDKVMCLYPPDVASEPGLPPQMLAKLDHSFFIVAVHFENTTMGHSTFRVPSSAFPHELVSMVLLKRSTTTGQALEETDEYVLKVCGKEEYFLGNYPLSQYLHMRRCITKGITPQLMLVHKETLLQDQPPPLPHRSIGQGAPTGRKMSMTNLSAIDRSKCYNLWDLSDHYYSITINKAANVNWDDFTKLHVRVGLYHGGDTICSPVNSKEVLLKDNLVNWDHELMFEICLPDIPRMARLAFSLIAIADKRTAKERGNTAGGRNKKKRQQEVDPVAWVNIPVFDYRGTLRTGQYTLYMWQITDDDIFTSELLNPIGTVECDPNSEESVALTVTFHNYNLDRSIVFPPFDKVLEVAASNSDFEIDKIDDIVKKDTVKKSHLEQLRVMIDRDPLHPLHEQDKELIWRLKYECQYHFPHSLPKLLSCVQWNSHKEVAKMQALLQIWPPLPPIQALELLDFAYADNFVRKFAVKCLQAMSDGELSMYLLQLVQVLKYESYLECDLVEFLLKRALFNQRIGHYFFWLLRSEMHVSSVSVRFALILEAYFHGNKTHLKPLMKQVQALRKMKSINLMVKQEEYKDIKKLGIKEKALQEMRSLLRQNPYTDVLSDLHSTLDPALRMRQPMLEKCKFMDSKMRPLQIVFENHDQLGDEVFLMYKNGDDLRQDMLTLQILRIIDSIWQADGLDLRLNIYGCLATGWKEGVIEMVVPSKTIANIQREFAAVKLKSAFNYKSMYKWLAEHNTDDASLKKAIEEFTLSCTGYCVATYVLGIADRHNDNIMMKKNGQLFHIDFGHILGHFKTKFGFKRERVPFVLTKDFVYLIRRGPQNDDNEFRRFQQYCEAAFLALRRKSNFLLTLFMMMTNTGIPELSSVRDVEYLKEALVPHYSEEDALIHFREKFQDALKNSWKTSMNWAVHIMNTTDV